MVEVCAICDIEGCVHIRERERLRGFPGQALASPFSLAPTGVHQTLWFWRCHA